MDISWYTRPPCVAPVFNMRVYLSCHTCFISTICLTNCWTVVLSLAFEIKSRSWRSSLFQIMDSYVTFKSIFASFARDNALDTNVNESRPFQTLRPMPLLVDEAAHAHEPEVLLPVGRFFHGLRSVILMRNEEQLALSVTSERRNKFAAQHAMIFFARLQLSGISPITLRAQYRMAPSILKVIRDNCYAGKLTDHACTATRRERERFLQFVQTSQDI